MAVRTRDRGGEDAMSGKKIYLIIQGALCVLLCAFLILGTAALYREGAAPIYSREKAGEALLRLLPLALLLLALTAGGLILGVRDDKKKNSTADHAMARRPARSGAEKRAAAWRWTLLAAAAVLIAAGILNGGMRDVLAKAIKICTECVGLG